MSNTSEINFDYWLQRGSWNLFEACYLVFEKDPRYLNPADQLEEEHREFYNLAHSNLGIKLNVHGKDPLDGSATVIPAEFVQWAQTVNYEIPEPLKYLLVGHNSIIPSSKNNKSKYISKIEQRAKIIGSEANSMFKDPMQIEHGGKMQLNNHLCEKYSKSFSPDTFNQAWKLAKKLKLIEMYNVKQYKHT